MSDEDSAAPKKKKKGGKFGKIGMIVGAIALLGGGGAATGFYVAGGMKKEAGPVVDPNKPQLVLKGENPEEIAAQWTAKAEEAAKEGAAGKPTGKGAAGQAKGIDMPRPKPINAYHATYFQIPAPFTTNMSDSDAFAQISIAISTYYDNRVIQAVQTHELAIRSSILMMLAQESQLALSTPEGKEILQTKLVKLINEVLKQRTGYGGVDNVYFTNFVIQ
jgi:flagellar protein FliL